MDQSLEEVTPFYADLFKSADKNVFDAEQTYLGIRVDVENERRKHDGLLKDMKFEQQYKNKK